MTGIIDAFNEGATATVAESIGSDECVKTLSEIDGLASAVESFCPDCGPAAFASAAEFILEGLYLHSRIRKESLAGSAQYRG